MDSAKIVVVEGKELSISENLIKSCDLLRGLFEIQQDKIELNEKIPYGLLYILVNILENDNIQNELAELYECMGFQKKCNVLKYCTSGKCMNMSFDHKYCAVHKCQIDDCEKEPIYNYNYCYLHKCGERGCYNNKSDSIAACGMHKCSIDSCPNLKDKHLHEGLYCEYHYCNYDKCSKFKINSKSFCEDHKCEVDDCNYHKKDGELYCLVHSCRCAECCELVIRGMYCKNHKCQEQYCLNLKIGNMYCVKHKCQRRLCDKKSIDDFKWCVDHKN